MPIYFFHITEGEEYIPDPQGLEQPNLAAAQQEASYSASGLIAEAVRAGVCDYQGRLDVENERGEKVFTMMYACSVHTEVIAPSPGGR